MNEIRILVFRIEIFREILIPEFNHFGYSYRVQKLLSEVSEYSVLIDPIVQQIVLFLSLWILKLLPNTEVSNSCCQSC